MAVEREEGNSGSIKRGKNNIGNKYVSKHEKEKVIME